MARPALYLIRCSIVYLYFSSRVKKKKYINTYSYSFIGLYCILLRRASDSYFMYHWSLSLKKGKLKFKIEYLTFANEINFYGYKGRIIFFLSENYKLRVNS